MFKNLKKFWKNLDRPILVGERYENNLKAITYMSVVSAVLGLVMVIINTVQHRGWVTLTSYSFFICGTISGIASGVFKKRKVSAVLASVLCAIIFTYYAVSGETDGAAILWAMVMPMGISYFINLKSGIILSIYFQVLVIILFYTPLQDIMGKYYSDSMMTRYPIVFFCVAACTLIGMTQYHAMALREIEYEKRLKEEVEQQKKIAAELEKMSDARNRFFTSMSHEIRTPINAIIGFNEMILREHISDEILEDAENIGSASKLLLHLINDILDISKLESGKMDLSPAPYMTEELFVDVAGMMAVRAKQKGLKFEVDISPDTPTGFIGDEIRIKQILINLVNNAIKYTYEGSVKVSVKCVAGEDKKADLICSVEDTGIGIKEENIPFLFDVYHRADEEDTKHIEGTGLGLSIVKQFIGLMGGKVEVQSVYGKGSTFTVVIPQQISDARNIGRIDIWKRSSNEDRTLHRAGFEAPKASILIVDDTPSNTLVATKLLRQVKVRIDTAENGLQALDKTLHRVYDIIFLDHLMPNMDGVECFHRIKEQQGGLNKNTKVVALTANSMDNSGAIYLSEGFDGFLSKPFTGEQLEQTVLKMLPPELVIMKTDESTTHLSGNTIETEEKKDMLEYLKSKGFHIEETLENLGNDESIYYEILDAYVNDMDNVSENLQKFYDEENWDEYRILVHSIKSTSMMIGAYDLGEEAKDLEFAARDGEISVIKKDHAKLMEHYREMKQLLKR